MLTIWLNPPEYTLEELKKGSGQLMSILRDRGAQFETKPWNGQLDSLPDDAQGFVRVGGDISCPIADLAQKMKAKGLLGFSENYLLAPGGWEGKSALIKAVNAYLDQE